MKTITCSQLGGPESCTKEFTANSFDEVAQMSKAHAMENMMEPAHMEKMQEMMELMKDPQALQKWMDEKKQEYDHL